MKLKRALSLNAFVALAALTACSDPEPEAPKLSKEGESCQVAADCEQALTCRNEICIALNVPVDMDTQGDMGTQADMPANTGNQTTVKAEDYVISYVVEKGSGENKGRSFLFALDTETGEKTQVSEQSNHCDAGCWLSEDLSYFVYIRPSSTGINAFDIYTTSVQDLKAQGEGSVVAMSVERVLFHGSAVSFMRGEGANKAAYYMELGSTMDQPIGKLSVTGDTNNTQDSWQYSKAAGKAAVFSPTLQTLSIRVADTGTSITEGDQIYLIDAANYQEVGGSYFGSNIPAAFSPDGRYLAILTSAPNKYNLCEGNAQCDASLGQHCGEEKVCTAREVTVRTFDLEATDELENGTQDGKKCEDDTECSPAHECYIPSEVQLDQAVCVPRRIVLGLPDTPKQPRVGGTQKSGCELTQGAASHPYTTARAPISFGADGNIYVVGARECAGNTGELNIGDTDILRISPLGGGIDVVSGNPGENFDDGRCYDFTENEIDIKNCIVYIQQAVLSPMGNELAFLATNPNVQGAETAASSLDVWTVLGNGEGREWLGNTDLFDEVSRIRVHSKKP